MDHRFLVSNDQTTVSAAVSTTAAVADEIKIAVAYVSDARVREEWLQKGVSVKLLVALHTPRWSIRLTGRFGTSQ